MGALTQTYCDYAAGNDYKGATFTDGAYTSATKTLVKTGAFAASKVNHWLYLNDNGSGVIVDGYYKIATATDADTVVLATDAGAGSDATDVKCIQADGTTSLPWRSVQGAFDLVGRDATNGNQVNVIAGTAQVLAAALTLATYGTPAVDASLVIRGCTAIANDGGKGEINCNGVKFWVAAYQYWLMVDINVHSFGDNDGITGTTNGYYGLIACEVSKGASSPSGKTLFNGNNGFAIGCYVHDAGTNGIGIYTEVGGHAAFNFVKDCPKGIYGNAIFNVISGSTTAAITLLAYGRLVIGNSIYSSAATGSGILIGTQHLSVIINNIIEGFSGSGGKGISSTTRDTGLLGYNAFYNNTTNESMGDIMVDLGNDATPASSPFTNAGSGDFSLATAVAGAIDGAFPGAWYGPAATTDHADIGAVQNPAGTGGVIRRVARLLGG